MKITTTCWFVAAFLIYLGLISWLKPEAPDNMRQEGVKVYKNIGKNKASTINLYHEAAARGDAKGQFKLAQCYATGTGVKKNLTIAAQLYLKAAEQGNIDAQCRLGDCYKNGEGVDKDAPKAMAWYRKAAEQGDAESQYKLGLFYMRGECVATDLTEAAAWYRKAAEQGFPASIDFLAVVEKSLSPEGLLTSKKRSREIQQMIDAKLATKIADK
jgi:TPR repeat protein